MRVVIVGAGIGGLATARALACNGIDDYVVLEQAPEMTEIGAGVQMTNNATRVLDYLGLADDLQRTEVNSKASTYRDLVTDELIFETPAGENAHRRYGFPYLQMHRARLLEVLQNAIPTDRIRLSARCVAVQEDAKGVAAELESGELVKGDVLIGCDGIHSVVRRRLAPPEEPVFSGTLGWRALIPYEKAHVLGLDHRQHSWWGPGRSVIAYWVAGGRLLNFLGLVPSTEVHTESWRTYGDISQLRASYRGACARLTRMVDMIDDAFITGVFDRPPLEHYVAGRVALLGDAAHPLWPYLANGAAQALEDAVVLARCLARNPDDIPAALKDYEARRLPRANYVQRRSREMGETCHLSDPERIRARNQLLAKRMAEDPSGGWLRDWLWGYDAIAAADLPLAELPTVEAVR